MRAWFECRRNIVGSGACARKHVHSVFGSTDLEACHWNFVAQHNGINDMHAARPWYICADTSGPTCPAPDELFVSD
jgi:hypothetical protein